MNIWGWFDNKSDIPAHDPGISNTWCPFCYIGLDMPLKTISVMGYYDGADRSYFYRAHKACYENASPESITRLESEVIDGDFNLLEKAD